MFRHYEIIKRVPWEWRVELTIAPSELALFKYSGGGLTDPSKLVYQQFIRNIAVGEGLRVGAAHVFIEEGHGIRQHAHVLLMGRNYKGKTLAGISRARLEGYWPYGKAHAQVVTDNAAAVGYLAKNCREGRDTVALSGQSLLNEWLCEETTPTPAGNEFSSRSYK